MVHYVVFCICLAASALAGSPMSNNLIDGAVVVKSDPLARFTVALGFAPTNNPDDGITPFCTGALVGDGLVITAAHCMQGARNTHVIFETNALAFHPQTAPVIAYEIPAEFKGGYDHAEPVPKDNHDVALVRFAGHAPAGSQPVEPVPPDYAVETGSWLTIAGYGHWSRTEEPEDKIGILRKAALRVLDAGYSSSEVAIDGSQGPQNAGGDSGGPALVSIDGRYFIFAICNWGRHDKFSIFAKVRPQLQWLREAAGHLGMR